MADDPGHRAAEPASFATRVTRAGRSHARDRHFVNPPVVRGSTVLHPDCADRQAAGKSRMDQAMVYGLLGTPTHHALEDMIVAIEGGTRCQIVSSGLAACTVPLLAFLSAGDHCLVTDSVYGPTRHFCDVVLSRLGIETTYYAPTIDGAGLAQLIRPNSRVLFLESPGSHTFEVQDVPALASVARAHGLKVLMDNTWGIHFFQPFRHGVDVSIQALTKYLGGHSDVLLGSITTNARDDWERVRSTATALGHYASSDDCWLALRGARTLAVRLAHQMESGLSVARWLADREDVLRVLHPALPGAPGHEIWRRDFTGACSLFGVVFRPEITPESVTAMIDALHLFGIGASWGGFESLALPTTGTIKRTLDPGLGGPAARLHIGLEDPANLIADLEQAFARLRSP